MGGSSGNINLGAPELELIDPTPNIHFLFFNFDKLFFWSMLSSRAAVRWSKRMYSCAGTCSYDGRGGFCDIALSEPLLKLRPRKDLVETLLHEMIHAYLFITDQDNDRDGHGPKFQAHMHRLNKAAGVNITIYHNFNNEVKQYLTHWWRCNGPCQFRKPYFGVIRKTCNRPPAPSDNWWLYHQETCGGIFTKIKEPKKINKKKGSNTKSKTNKTTQTMITYLTPTAKTLSPPVINNNDNNSIDKNVMQTNNKQPNQVLKDTSNTLANNNFGDNNLVYKANILSAKIIKRANVNNPPVNQNVNQFNPPIIEHKPPIFNKTGNESSGRQLPPSVNVVETVRNAWVQKQIQTASSSKVDGLKEKNANSRKSVDTTTPNRHKSKKIFSGDAPPQKVQKLETDEELATSVLKDVYGKDFKVSRADNKLVANSAVMVHCPICSVQVEENKINSHLDECLNTSILNNLCKDDESKNKHDTNYYDAPLNVPGNTLKKSKTKKSTMVKSNTVNINAGNVANFIDLTGASIIEKEEGGTRNITDTISPKRVTIDNNMPSTSKQNSFDPKDVAKVQSITKKINYDKHVEKSGHVEPAGEIKLPSMKIEEGDDISNIRLTKCPCCNNVINKPIEQHLDECLAFFANNATIPEEGASTSFSNVTIVIDDDFDDEFDETQTLNATGTKNPCPCCMEMVEQANMNSHLNLCLAS